MTPGRIVSVSGEATDCPTYGSSLLCQWFDKTLAPGGATRITVRVHLPANVPYESCARLDAPASGEQACIGGMPVDPPPPREVSLPGPVCSGGTFLMRPPAGPAQCCSLRSIAAGTCGGGRTGCADGHKLQPAHRQLRDEGESGVRGRRAVARRHLLSRRPECRR